MVHTYLVTILFYLVIVFIIAKISCVFVFFSIKMFEERYISCNTMHSRSSRNHCPFNVFHSVNIGVESCRQLGFSFVV